VAEKATHANRVDTITCPGCVRDIKVVISETRKPCPHCGYLPRCTACGYETAVTYVGHTQPSTKPAFVNPEFLCHVCRHTECIVNIEATIAYCTNLILDAIRKGPTDDTH